MGRAKKEIYYRVDRQAYYFRFKSNDQLVIRKLGSQDEIEYKLTTSGRRKRKEAEKQRFLEELAAEARASYVPTNLANRSTLGDWVSTWADQLTLRTAQAKREYISAVQRFIEIVGDTKLENLTANSSYEFIRVLDQRGLSRNTIRSYLRMVSIYLNYLHSQELIPKISLRTVPEETRTIGVYSMEDLDRIESYLEQRQHRNGLRMVKMLRYLGMRPSEVRTLPLRHINLGKQRLSIRKVEELDWVPKKGKEAHLPIPSPLLNFLEQDLAQRYRQEKYYLDTGQGSLAYDDVSAMSKIIRPVLKEMKLYGEVKPLHGYRASLVTSLLRAKVPPHVVQEICRHSKLETTMNYANRNMEDLRLALEQPR